ncbi:hypothetical protein AB0H77_22050 [Streptomyces sp. NPDC050844]|uniref:hypothetical protein n=1 Tax=Streptomyces sp. NPDC050844 TaxID=3155790 RepID=UPI0033F027EC
MQEQHPAPHLTPAQASVIEFARADLARARITDLGALDSAGLLLQVERLRTRLDDVLGVIDDLVEENRSSEADPSSPATKIPDRNPPV